MRSQEKNRLRKFNNIKLGAELQSPNRSLHLYMACQIRQHLHNTPGEAVLKGMVIRAWYRLVHMSEHVDDACGKGKGNVKIHVVAMGIALGGLQMSRLKDKCAILDLELKRSYCFDK